MAWSFGKPMAGSSTIGADMTMSLEHLKSVETMTVALVEDLMIVV